MKMDDNTRGFLDNLLIALVIIAVFICIAMSDK